MENGLTLSSENAKEKRVADTLYTVNKYAKEERDLARRFFNQTHWFFADKEAHECWERHRERMKEYYSIKHKMLDHFKPVKVQAVNRFNHRGDYLRTEYFYLYNIDNRPFHQPVDAKTATSGEYDVEWMRDGFKSHFHYDFVPMTIDTIKDFQHKVETAC